MPFYASYLPTVVQANLRPIVQSSPMIFENCINTIPTNNVAEKFDEIYERCRPVEDTTTTTTTTPVDSTTVEPDDDASGNFEDELATNLGGQNSYFLV